MSVVLWEEKVGILSAQVKSFNIFEGHFGVDLYLQYFSSGREISN